MMDPTNGDRVFVADLAAKCARLREANVMRFGGRTATYDARLRGDESAVLLIAQTNGLRRHAATADNGRFWSRADFCTPLHTTFSRAFAEFARSALPDKIHAALIERALGGRIIGAIARDATEIEAREKPVHNKANDGKDDPPAPNPPPPPRKRGRPRKANSGQSRSRRVSSGRSRRTSARCSPTCRPPATSAARKTARATKRPGPGTNSTSTWPAAKSRSPAY